ncbi:MAG TPA: DEAD/DEAH box helicase, partial [Jatrophihabitantaceae bacterium]|nr:DEAD/DEAH box helicase [Jatrophihabitantaceae bacterium]
MSSPAERYQAARHRRKTPELTSFRAGYPFELDDFQARACEQLESGYGVLVCAPTGAGKTVVGEFAVHLALAAGQKCFYTTPIKALSNQKFADLVSRYGAEKVGLLTGDNAVNSDAPVVVMTTEVLRNMLYVSSPALAGLGYVVMDEVHYLGDRFRGAVWEEAIIHLPAAVRLVSLSATVSNAEEFGDWLITVRGDTKVIVHETRPVPLWQHMLVGPRLFDLFGTGDGAGDRVGGDPAAPGSGVRPKVDAELVRYINERMRYVDPGAVNRQSRDHGRGHAGGRRPPRGWRPPSRPDVITRLNREGLLPAITFIFSRAGCDAAVRQCVHAGLWLTEPQEREPIRALVELRTKALDAADLDVLGYWEFLDGLTRGVAAHHAGMVPVFKETVEALFERGLVRAVFATETLSLGINMPARTVVLERLTKFDGQGHAAITPGEYTQLTGRAGRRGIDVEGHAVVLWSPEVDATRVAGLASTRTYPLRSSFRPSYNMAVNLVSQLGRAAARKLLDASFAQFQTDRSVVGLVAQIQRNEATRAEYAERQDCHLGDFAEYAALRRELGSLESDTARTGNRLRTGAVVASMEALAIGDVIRISRGKRAGLAIVVDPGVRSHDDPRPLVVTEQRWAGRLSPLDFEQPVEALARVRVALNFDHRSPQARRDLASNLHRLGVASSQREHGRGERGRPDRRGGSPQSGDVAALRARLRAHPSHHCPDREEHARWAERSARLSRENDTLERKIDGRT